MRLIPGTGSAQRIASDGTQTNLGGGYNSPVGVVVDGLYNVYVADTYNVQSSIR